MKAEAARLSEIERRKAEAKKQQEAALRQTQEAAFQFLEKQIEHSAATEDVTEEDFKNYVRKIHSYLNLKVLYLPVD